MLWRKGFIPIGLRKRDFGLTLSPSYLRMGTASRELVPRITPALALSHIESERSCVSMHRCPEETSARRSD